MPTTLLTCPACHAAVATNVLSEKQPVCPDCGMTLPVTPAPPEADAWYYAHGKEKRGPLPLAELKQLADAGRLLPGDMVLRAGAQRWGSAGSVPGLFLAPTTPPATAQPAVLPLPPSAAPVKNAAAQGIGGMVAFMNGLIAGPTRRPWNPTLLFCLGLLFGLPWLGAVIAINHRRLRLSTPLWRSLGIGAAFIQTPSESL
jgi:GYF domain 2